MQTDYLFLIPLMPQHLMDEQRKALRKLCFEQIQKINSSKRVWLLGEIDEKIEGFENIQVKGITKEDKLWEVGNILKSSYTPPARFLVRLDDDDLINPIVFDQIVNEDFDCYTDEYHHFYDLSSAQVSTQKRDWIPNTAIHKYNHAMKKVEAQGGGEQAGDTNYLFACDHSLAWHVYYNDKKVKYTSKKNPIYLRVLNPGSITAKSDEINDYISYLSGFGNWNAQFPINDAVLQEELKNIWLEENSELSKYNFPKQNLIKRSIKALLKK